MKNPLSDDAKTIPNFCLRYSNASHGRGFVKRSTTCSFEGTCSSFNFCSSTYSLRKWYLIGICLILESIKNLFETLIALVLSHIMEMGGEKLIWISCNVRLIQGSCVQHDATSTYSSSTVDKEIELCFCWTVIPSRTPYRILLQ